MLKVMRLIHCVGSSSCVEGDEVDSLRGSSSCVEGDEVDSLRGFQFLC